MLHHIFQKVLLPAALAGTMLAGTSAPAVSLAAQAATQPDSYHDDWLHVNDNAEIVDKDGNPVWITGCNWFGYNVGSQVFDGVWSQNMHDMLRQIADHGFNFLRIPMSTEILLQWKNGDPDPATPKVNQYTNPELTEEGIEGGTIKYSFDIWNMAVKWCRELGIKIMIDIHSAETCAARVLEKNPELLIMVEGTEVYPKEGYDWTAPRIDYTTMTEYYYGTWWGGNFRGAKKYPIDLGKYQSQLVYSPHDYGPLVWEQKWFYDGFTQETLLKDCWYDNWFFLQDEGVAPLLMGEWGGFMDGDKNEQWMTYLRDFMIENRIHHTFWCFNENSGDTGGLVYDNFGKWDEDKYALVKPALWQDDNGKFISLDHTIALGSNGISLSDYYGGGNNNTTEPDSKIIAGDVNSDKLVNGVDLTLMRQNITKWQSTDDVLTASPQDTNGNGVFSIADIVLLTQYLLGKDVILKSYSS